MNIHGLVHMNKVVSPCTFSLCLFPIVTGISLALLPNYQKQKKAISLESFSRHSQARQNSKFASASYLAQPFPPHPVGPPPPPHRLEELQSSCPANHSYQGKA